MKFDKKYITGRFSAIVIGALLVCVLIIWKALYTATVDRDKWMQVAAISVSDTLVMNPVRGNILSADGQLMASSLPDYKLYVDFLSGVERKDSIGPDGKKIGKFYDQRQLAEKDSVWLQNMDSICKGLARICPRYTEDEYRVHSRIQKRT